MTSENFIKAQLALLAWREAAHLGGINNMLAICFMIRNRVRAGWGDWMQCIQNYDLHRAEEVNSEVLKPMPDVREPNFIKLLQQIDGIYDGTAHDKLTTNVPLKTDPYGKPGLYCAELHNITRDWFRENISLKSTEHPRTSVVGSVVFFG